MYLVVVDKIKRDCAKAKIDIENLMECVDCKLTESDIEHCKQLTDSIQKEADLIEEHTYKFYREIDRLNHYIKEG